MHQYKKMFCALCGHHESMHYNWTQGTKQEAACRGTGTRCDCDKFCEHFEPSERDGVRCESCGKDFLDHEDVKRQIDTRLMVSDNIYHIQETSRRYRVAPAGMSRCCLWTIFQYTRLLPDEQTIKLDDVLECQMCFNEVRCAAIDPGPIPFWRNSPPVSTALTVIEDKK